MRYFIALATLITATIVGGGVALAGEPDPPNKTGCCFSFDDSPVNIIFCAVPGACQFEEL